MRTSTLQTYELPIGGSWTPADSGATYDTLDPFRGEPWATRSTPTGPTT